MKIKSAKYNEANINPTVAVEFDGRQPTLPLVEDLVKALSEAYSWNLKYEFRPQQSGPVYNGRGARDCYLIKIERQPKRIDTVARVEAGKEDEKAIISMFDRLREHGFLKGYTDRLLTSIV